MWIGDWREAIAECGLLIADCGLLKGEEMDSRELEERTKIFATNVIQLISTLPIRKEKRHCKDSE